MEEYGKQSVKIEKKVSTKSKVTKTFVDPIFGVISSPRFRMCRIYLDGKWKAELWDDIDNEEYHLSFKNFEGTKVTCVFPTVQDRVLAAHHIIPDKKLELPHNHLVIQTVSENVPVKEEPHVILKSLVVGSTLVALGWALVKQFHKQGQKVLNMF